jgi:hypothetical protein
VSTGSLARKDTHEIRGDDPGASRKELARRAHLFNLATSLRLFDEMERSISEYDERLLREIEARLAPGHVNRAITRRLH